MCIIFDLENFPFLGFKFFKTHPKAIAPTQIKAWCLAPLHFSVSFNLCVIARKVAVKSNIRRYHCYLLSLEVPHQSEHVLR